MIMDISSSSSLDLTWIPGHSGFIGNERANHLAKKAANSSLQPSFHKIPPSYIKKQIWYAYCINIWQELWNVASTGRLCHAFIPNIAYHLSIKFFKPDYYNTQLMTGHGNFRHYLHRFKLLNNELCDCGIPEPQDTSHLLFNCNSYVTPREKLLRATLQHSTTWPCELKTFLAHESTFSALQETSALAASFPSPT